MPISTRILPILFWAMVALLSTGLAAAFALGFGAPIPALAVNSLIGSGTVAMIGVFAVLIASRTRS